MHSAQFVTEVASIVLFLMARLFVLRVRKDRETLSDRNGCVCDSEYVNAMNVKCFQTEKILIKADTGIPNLPGATQLSRNHSS